jgi:hypothetical protein
MQASPSLVLGSLHLRRDLGARWDKSLNLHTRWVHIGPTNVQVVDKLTHYLDIKEINDFRQEIRHEPGLASVSGPALCVEEFKLRFSVGVSRPEQFISQCTIEKGKHNISVVFICLTFWVASAGPGSQQLRFSSTNAVYTWSQT